MTPRPVWTGYFADPAVIRTERGYVAYGTDPGLRGGGAFSTMVSPDLLRWRPAQPVLTIDPDIGTDYWAPEVVQDGPDWWMFYSAGFGIADHHLRVAHASSPLGPFSDQGVDLSPAESFAIDAHPFTDQDGQRYLFFARDVLDADRPGTHLAVMRMRSWTEPDGPVLPVLEPNATWQRYEADRAMYGRRMDWYTLEGPSVVQRDDEYVLFFSGGSWEGADYGVATATAPSPLGPWTHASDGAPTVLSAPIVGRAGPGHNSLIEGPDHRTWIAFHAWDDAMRTRQPYTAPLRWSGTRPTVDLDTAARIEDATVRGG